MPKFPKSEIEKIRLAEDVAAGLRAHADVFPSPPISPDEMDKQIAAYKANHETVTTSRAVTKQGITAKDESLKMIEATTKTNIRYAENTAHNDSGKLQFLGWNVKKQPARPTDATPPDQVDVLSIAGVGKGSITLSWQAPPSGAPVSTYRIQRQKADGTGDWVDVGSTSGDTQITLTGQDVGVPLLYQVIASNRSGDSPASNVVKATL